MPKPRIFKATCGEVVEWLKALPKDSPFYFSIQPINDETEAELAATAEQFRPEEFKLKQTAGAESVDDFFKRINAGKKDFSVN